MPLEGDSLDAQYQSFRDRTRAAFQAEPRMEPMRPLIFKRLLAQQDGVTPREYIEHITLPLRAKSRTTGVLKRAPVLILLESARDVISDPIIQVCAALKALGVGVQVVSQRGPAQFPEPVWTSPETTAILPPKWAKMGWQSLIALYPELNRRPLYHRFLMQAAYSGQGFNIVNQILDTVQPKVVLCASTNLTFGATLCVAARLRNTKSLLLQHGIVQVFYTPIVADQILVWGETTVNALKALGVLSSEMVVTGSPRHDSMGGKSLPSTRHALTAKLGLPDVPTLVFFSNGNDLVRNGDAPRQCAEWLEAQGKAFAGRANIVVRLHPNEDGSLYRGMQHLALTKKEASLGETLQGCDLVASLCSTVLYEALLYRKPVWQFYADGWASLATNWEEGLATRVASQAELLAQTEALLTNPSGALTSEETVASVFANHGTSAHATAAYIASRIA
jgi:hypothetical protein